jgi:hypothetical protein
MSTPLPSTFAPENRLRDALGDIRACYAEIESFMAGTFDKLEQVLDEARTEQAVDGQAKRLAERDTLDGQIARLAAIAEQLAQSVAQQQQWTAKRKRP